MKLINEAENLKIVLEPEDGWDPLALPADAHFRALAKKANELIVFHFAENHYRGTKIIADFEKDGKMPMEILTMRKHLLLTGKPDCIGEHCIACYAGKQPKLF